MQFGKLSAAKLHTVLFSLLALWLAAPAAAQDIPDGTIVRRVDVNGLQAINEGFVRRILKTRVGQPFQRSLLQEDVRELLRTRKFVNVFAQEPTLEDGEVVVVFVVAEKPEIASVEIDGNKRFTDEELFGELAFTGGSVLDMYDVNRGRENILRKYQEAGHFYAEVTLDAAALEAENRVIYHVTEGPRVKVQKILFEGVRSFPETQLYFKVKTQTYFWFFRTGAFDPETTERDAVELQAFYRGEGYLDARVGYRLDFDDVDRTQLNVVFVVEEGVPYRAKEVRIRGAEAFSFERIAEVMQVKPGSLLRDENIREDVRRIQDLYGEIGYVDAHVETSFDFVEEPGVAILNVDVSDGLRSRVGRITIRGNPRTQDRVIRRELRFYPGEDYNTLKTKDSEGNLMDTGLFNRATITPLDDIDGYREAVVEVEEGQFINFIVGVGISTDNGVLGSLTIENRNFDLFDIPRNWTEFFRAQAFRGAGQRIRFQAEPGTEQSRFRIDFTEPYLFEKAVRLDASFYLFERQRDAYDEQRVGTVWSLSKRFETGLLRDWAVEGAVRVEEVKIDNIDALAANDIIEVKGSGLLTSVKGGIVRDTTDSRLVPTKGYRFGLGWEQVGALGGEWDFGKPSASFAWYKTVSTDVFDRKSVVAVRADAGFIVGDAPVFERFYGGGFGSIRGFDFRGVSPRQGIFNNRVGGDFILLVGGEYSVPLYAENVRGVAFLDMGTVERDFEITSWRASVGFGLRVNLNFFGPVPMVFDFGFPIAKDDEDDTRIFNFSIGASF